MNTLIVVGDTLLDRDLEGRVDRLSPDAPVPVVDEERSVARPGGAGLAALLLAGDGRRVRLVTAIADDDAGCELRTMLAAADVDVVAMPMRGTTPEKVRVRSDGTTMLRLDRGKPGPVGPGGPAVRRAIASASAVLVADYGRGVTGDSVVRSALADIARDRPVVWDPHPSGAQPVAGCRLVTPNHREGVVLAGGGADGLAGDVERARRLRERWGATGVALTRGRAGAVVVDAGDTPLAVPIAVRAAGSVDHGRGRALDVCGAGDRFSSRALAVLDDGGLLSDAVVAAVEAATDFVVAGGAAGLALPWEADQGSDPDARPSDAVSVAEEIRRRGGTVVATGGCFDLLHAGHVRMLEAARSLGDCLVVCLNSDDSVRARKGPGRPVVPAADRAAILTGLRSVDAVAVFDESTPDGLLRQLRPHVWAKGADYTVADLPEAATVASWGGETVVLPYLDGRSTTAMLKEAQRHA